MAEVGGRKIRKSNFSPEEIETLVNTVSKHYNILYGEFAKRAINKHARHRVWLDVTKQVNRVSVERRTLQEVKNKWKKCQHLYKDQEKLQIPEEFDSMPLEQRLSKTSTEEPVLQSQPLSPTKLKVTRQTAKPPQNSPKAPTPEPPNEEVCLRWNSHHSNMQNTFPNLLLREQYVDATLVAEGQTLKCHRLILSSCSPYFEEVLSGISPFQHPVLFMKDIPFWILKSLCDFMYAGEVHIFQNRLEELLAVAETLKIKGLAGKQEGNEEIKPTEPVKPVKDEKKEEKKRHSQGAQQNETPATKSNSRARSTHASRRNERLNKELVKSDDILDPLDLLEPVYEELTKESKQTSTAPKFKENKVVPVRRSLTKKLKKRKLTDEREESPPPLFLSRKGTRSRPNVKIPKFYHPPYDRASKPVEFPESTIVREPHTDQADPLMQIDEIKAEPLDLEEIEDVIEIEDNVVGFPDQEMPLHDEEIIGNYDSPIVNLNDKPEENKEVENLSFKKISLIQQPIIMDVHSVTEKPSEAVKIVDVEQLKSPTEPLENKSSELETEHEHETEREHEIPDTETDKVVDDPLNLVAEHAEKSEENNTVSEVEAADSEVNNVGEKEEEVNFHIEKIVGGHEENEECNTEGEITADDVAEDKESEENGCELGFHIAKVASEQIAANEESKGDAKEVISEDCSNELGFQITNIVSGHFDLDGKGDDITKEAEETIVNSLPETADESQVEKESVDALGTSSEPVSDLNDALSDETRLIAESLEELLEK